MFYCCNSNQHFDDLNFINCLNVLTANHVNNFFYFYSSSKNNTQIVIVPCQNQVCSLQEFFAPDRSTEKKTFLNHLY